MAQEEIGRSTTVCAIFTAVSAFVCIISSTVLISHPHDVVANVIAISGGIAILLFALSMCLHVTYGILEQRRDEETDPERPATEFGKVD